MKAKIGARRVHWGWKLFILAPALVVAIMSVLALDTIGVRFLAVYALLFAVLLWCGMSLGGIPWKRTFLILVVSVALSTSVLVFCLPVRVAAIISGPALNRLADRVEAGEEIDTPVVAGVFLIRKTELWNGMPCLWTFLGGDGRDGLARPADGVAENKFNYWSAYRLHDNWFVIAED